jgi:hypothetical protein
MIKLNVFLVVHNVLIVSTVNVIVKHVSTKESSHLLVDVQMVSSVTKIKLLAEPVMSNVLLVITMTSVLYVLQIPTEVP